MKKFRGTLITLLCILVCVLLFAFNIIGVLAFDLSIKVRGIITISIAIITITMFFVYFFRDAKKGDWK